MRLAPHGILCYHSEVDGSDGGLLTVEKQGGVIRGTGFTPSSDISVFLIHSGSAESKGLALQRQVYSYTRRSMRRGYSFL